MQSSRPYRISMGLFSCLLLSCLPVTANAQTIQDWDEMGYIGHRLKEASPEWLEWPLPSAQIASVSHTSTAGRSVNLSFKDLGHGKTGIALPSQREGHLRFEKLQPDQQLSDGRWHLKGEAPKAHHLEGVLKASRPGTYSVEACFKITSSFEGAIRFEVGSSHTNLELNQDAVNGLSINQSLGIVRIERPGDYPWKLTAQSASVETEGIVLMHVILRTAPEGEPISQLADGSILLHARDVRIHGTKLQYEPLPHKNTVGYWVNESDQPSWFFQCLRPGRYAVEILQGCGKGHGGSLVHLSIDQTMLPFLVEETGHFQHFVPRIVGEVRLPRPDSYELRLIPIKKAGGAVMDVRQIRLIPLAEKP